MNKITNKYMMIHVLRAKMSRRGQSLTLSTMTKSYLIININDNYFFNVSGSNV